MDVIAYILLFLLKYAEAETYQGNGNVYFTYLDEQSKFGVRVIYSLDDTFEGTPVANETRACVSFLTDLPRLPTAAQHKALFSRPAIRGEMSLSGEGSYYYFETEKRNLLSNTWIPYRVNVYSIDAFPGCRSGSESLYEDKNKAYRVPEDVRYCQPYQLTDIQGLPCSQVMNRSIEYVTQTYKNTHTLRKKPMKLRKNDLRKEVTEESSTTPAFGCQGGWCKTHPKRVLLAVGCVPVAIIVVVLFSGIIRWIKAAKNDAAATRNRSNRTTPTNNGPSEFDLSLIAIAEGAQATPIQPPDYKDLKFDEPPPAYDELSQLSISIA